MGTEIITKTKTFDKHKGQQWARDRERDREAESERCRSSMTVRTRDNKLCKNLYLRKRKKLTCKTL